MKAPESCPHAPPSAGERETPSTGYFVLVLSITLVIGGLVASGVFSLDVMLNLVR
jgi:hypothetical protein